MIVLHFFPTFFPLLYFDSALATLLCGLFWPTCLLSLELVPFLGDLTVKVFLGLPLFSTDPDSFLAVTLVLTFFALAFSFFFLIRALNFSIFSSLACFLAYFKALCLAFLSSNFLCFSSFFCF